MRILSLDQASRTSGWAVLDDDNLIAYGHFTFDYSDTGSRLVGIRKKIDELINLYYVDYVIFEDIQQQANVANNVQTFKTLAEVYGVISELLTELQIPHSSILATSWKAKLGIKGRARAEQKKNAQQYVLDHYNKKVTQDEADAVCIGASYFKTEKCAWSD